MATFTTFYKLTDEGVQAAGVQGTTAQETAAQETAAQETDAQETDAQETAAQETAALENAALETDALETASQPNDRQKELIVTLSSRLEDLICKDISSLSEKGLLPKMLSQELSASISIFIEKKIFEFYFK